jgi:hypothetical protein
MGVEKHLVIELRHPIPSGDPRHRPRQSLRRFAIAGARGKLCHRAPDREAPQGAGVESVSRTTQNCAGIDGGDRSQRAGTPGAALETRMGTAVCRSAKLGGEARCE